MTYSKRRWNGNRQLRLQLFERQGETHPCPHCGVEMVLDVDGCTNAPHVATLGHINARWSHGDDSPANLRLECRQCNLADSKAEDEAATKLRSQAKAPAVGQPFAGLAKLLEPA